VIFCYIRGFSERSSALSETQEPRATNPESAFYAQNLLEAKQKRRKYGIIILLCSVVALIGLGVLVILAWSAHTALSFSQLLVFAGFTITCVMGIFAGVLDLRAGRQPVTSEEVVQVRQQARAELMRRARGYVPRAYGRLASIMGIILSCCLILMGSSFLLLPTSLAPWVNVLMAVLFFLGGLVFFWESAVVRPHEAKHLAAKSAQELANRLRLGEVTEGYSQEEQE
jgi:hypothetical protein